MFRSTGFVVALITVLLISAIEVTSWFVLRASGDQLTMFVSIPSAPPKREGGAGEGFGTLDPHLGYAHDSNETAVRNLPAGKIWVDGFLLYAEDLSSLQRPIILALGGSTTDGINYGHSWPEELSKIMRASGKPGTVINGGTGGYASSQEVLKLIRDGLAFRPDIVISYSGVNDRGSYSVPGHLMVHGYQLALMETLAGRNTFPIFPNTVRLIQNLSGDSDALNYSLGLKTEMSLAERFKMNIEMMNAVSLSQGAKFFSFIQPVAVLEDPSATVRGQKFVASVQRLYRTLLEMPLQHDYVVDATKVLDPHKHYKPDGVHLTQEGDQEVAKFIFGKIGPEM